MKDIVVAIDGFSGTGKSSTARAVASRLNYLYLDSGAMYRAVTLFFLQEEIDLRNSESVTEALNSMRLTFGGPNHDQINLNGKVLDQEIRVQQISDRVSEVAAISQVRKKMVALQRERGALKRVVMDGRDIGTVVFPNAELKIFMTADVDIRAERRVGEMTEKGMTADMESVRENLIQRDHIDSTREDSPLKKADDAIELDTSNLLFEEQVDKIVDLAKEIIYEN